MQLSTHERELMRRTLIEAMVSSELVRSPIRVVPSPYLFISSRLVMPLAFVLVVAVVGGSTAYAAEGAVPGDALYPIKVNVTEKVAEAFATSAEARASVHAKLAERRLKEAEVLVERGALTAEIKQEIETRLDHHASEVDVAAEAVGREDPVAAAGISTRLESALAAHGALIERLAEETEDESNREESRRFASALRERGKRLAYAEQGLSVVAARSAEGDIAVQTFAQSEEGSISASITMRAESDDTVVTELEKNASSTLQKAEKKLNALKNINATTAAQVKAQIGKTRDLIKHLHKEDKAGFERAFKDAETLKVFIEAQEEFKTRTLLPALEFELEGERMDEEGSEGEEDPLLGL